MGQTKNAGRSKGPEGAADPGRAEGQRRGAGAAQATDAEQIESQRRDEAVNFMVNVLQSKEFARLWEANVDHWVCWDEFATFPMPKGLTPSQMWKVVNSIRARNGTAMPFPPYLTDNPATDRNWYTLTTKAQTTIQHIAERAHADAWLNQTISRRKDESFLQCLMLPDMVAALHLDGMDVDGERATDIVLHGAPPQNVPERVLANLAAACAAEPRQRITRGSIELTYEQLWVEGAQDFHGTPLIGPIHNADFFTPDYVTDLLCHFDAGNVPEVAVMHPIIVGLQFDYTLWNCRPLPALNACVALLLRRSYFARSDYPALCHMGNALAVQQVLSGNAEFGVPLSGAASKKRTFDCGLGYDSSGDQELILDVCDLALSQLEKQVRTIVGREEAAANTISEQESLNMRQQETLLRMIRNPKHVEDIKTHCEIHHVAYATGRADLMGLADMGYLEHLMRNRAYEFAVGPRLVEVLRKALEQP